MFYVCVYMEVCVNVIRSNLSLWILLLYYHQGIYNYIPETNHVSRVCSVAAVLYLQFVLYVMLFCMCTFTLAFSEVCVQCLIWLFFCSSFVVFIIIIISVILRCVVHEIPRGYLSD